MRYAYKVILVLVILFLHAGVVWPEEIESVDHAIEPVLSADWVCYVKGGDLYIVNARDTSAPLKVSDIKDASSMIISPDLRVSGDLILVTWIERGTDGNNVLYRFSNDGGKTIGDVAVLSKNTKATHVRCLMDVKERIFVIEGSLGKKPLFSLYFSSDNGKTFKEYPLDMKGFSFVSGFAPLIVDDTLHFFVYGTENGKNAIATNSFEISTAKFKEYRTLKEPGVTSFIEAFEVNSEPAVIYKTFSEDTFILEGFIKGESGWEPFSIEAAGGLDVARLDHHVWDDGTILIVFSGEKKWDFKQRIYRALSTDKGKNWDVKRVDTKQYDNTRSWLPRLAVNSDKVAVVWEDSRDIRSKIRMNLSLDKGKTWLEKDFPISSEKKDAFRPRISFTKGAFFVTWDQFRDDEKKVADLSIGRLFWVDAERLARKKNKDLTHKEKEVSLRKSVEDYWNGMIKKDLGTTYRLHDPFYKARIPFEYYASHRGPMVYHSYDIEDIKVQGNVASVKVKVVYEVPKIKFFNKETSIPRKETVTEDTYLFIDGTWYRKFVDALSGGSAVNY